MIVNKHFEKIALIVVISLQGCVTNPTPVKEKIPFTAAQAEANRAAIENLARKDRAIANEESKRRTNEKIRIINAQKTNSTSTTVHQHF